MTHDENMAKSLQLVVLQRNELERRLDEAQQSIMGVKAINKDLHVKLGIGVAGHDDTVKKLKLAELVRNEAVAIVKLDRDALNNMELTLLAIKGMASLEGPMRFRINERIDFMRRTCVDRARGLTAWLATASSDAPRKK